MAVSAGLWLTVADGKRGDSGEVRSHANAIALVADGLVKDKKNGKIRLHGHGLNVFLTVENGVTTDVRIEGAAKAKTRLGGVHTAFDYDGDGWDDDTGEYVGQSCCKTEVTTLKRDGEQAVLAYGAMVIACGAAVVEGGANGLVDAACGLALLTLGLMISWVDEDVSELANCIQGHPGCTNWALREAARRENFFALAPKEEAAWRRIS